MRKKILAIAIIAGSVIGMAYAAPYRFWVFGSGSARDTDKQSAISQAYDAAVDQTNGACSGVVVRVERTSATCFGGGGDDSPYNCLVTVKGLCQLR
jgi:hypothetical protein